MLDSSLQYGIPQALIPPALIPPEKKKDWKDKLGQMLIQGDANWQPDDKTRRQMVKKGLLEAGLSMLANPSGYGNSPLIGISGGLLKGIGQMNNEADQLRGNQLNVNGNRLTDYQRKIQALQDPNTPEDVKQAIRISFGMDPRAINETWTSSLNPDGSLKASSNKGNVSILPVGQTTPQQFNLTGNPPPTAPAPPKPIVPTVTEVEAIGTQMLNNQIPPNEVNAWKAQQIALIQASQGMGNYGATQTQAPPVTQAPPSRIATGEMSGGLPDTRKPVEAKPEIWNNPIEVVKDGKVVLIERSNLGNERISQYQPKPNANLKTTEDQAKAAGYAERMDKGMAVIDSLVKADPLANQVTAGTAFLNFMPEAVSNMNKSANRQTVEAAQLDMLDAALTLNTGAAYTKEQLQGLSKSYFPQFGDKPETIKAKRKTLENLIATARIRAGSAGKPSENQQAGSPKVGQVVKGYRYKGGNPADKSSWEKTQ